MTKIARILTVAAIVAFTLSLNAEPAPMRAYIPFAFVAGEATLPPGEYTVRVDKINRVMIESRDTARAAGVLVSSQVEQSQSKQDMGSLEFAKYGDTYVLRNVWYADSTHGSRIVLSKRAHELARTFRTEVATLAVH
jgi:hypothetical protein